MKYRTIDVVNLLNKYISEGKTREAIDVFYRSLPKDKYYNQFRNDIANLLGQSNFLSREYFLQIRNDRVDFNRLAHSFQSYLAMINEREGRFIVLNQIPEFKKHLVPVDSSKANTLRKKIDWGMIFVSQLKRIFFISAIFFLFFIIIKIKKNKKTILPENNSIEYSSMIKKGEKISFWIIYLDKFQYISDAIKIKDAYPSRGIEILQSDDEFYLMIRANSEIEAEDKLTKNVKRRWKKAKIIPVYGCNLMFSEDKSYSICN